MQPLSVEQQFTCELCNNKIKERHEITLCPMCMNGFHTPHLASWFYTNSTHCPSCDGAFDELLVRELAPQSDVERWKYEVINILYNRGRAEQVSGNWIMSTLRKLASLVSNPFNSQKDDIISAE